MPKKTYTQINSVTLAASATSITFSSIPQNFRDLILVISTTGDGYILPRANGDSGNNYNRVVMTGSGSAAASFSSGNISSFDIGQEISGATTTFLIQFMDYSVVDKHKTVIARSDNTSTAFNARTLAGSYRWANTSAITSMQLPITGNYNSGSTFTLYGIEA